MFSRIAARWALATKAGTAVDAALPVRCYRWAIPGFTGRCGQSTSGCYGAGGHWYWLDCSVGYIKRVESVFEIIAEPNRRAILSLLALSQQSVGEIARQLHMPQPTVSKHLRVLRKAGFVESTVDAQRRLYRLKPEPLQEVDAWLAPFRRFWSAHVDALERHLDRMDQSTPE